VLATTGRQLLDLRGGEQRKVRYGRRGGTEGDLSL